MGRLRKKLIWIFPDNDLICYSQNLPPSQTPLHIFCPYLFSNYQLLIFFIEYLGRVRPTFKLSIGIISKLAKTWPLHCQMFQILNATDRPIVLWVKCNGDYNGRYNGMYRVVFFNWSAWFSVPKWKTSCIQPGLVFHEIFNVKKLLAGWASFFFILVLKIGRTS